MSESTWNPNQYDRFKKERSQPFYDLLDLVKPQPDMRAIDLGCGTGQHTRTLHQRLGCSNTRGIDSSPQMLELAENDEPAGLEFENADICDFAETSTCDLVFSNAALHWVDDHHTLFARLLDALKPGGQLAVQVPANHNHPSHTIAADIASQLPFRSVLGGYTRVSPVLTPEEYATLINQLGVEKQTVRLVVYPHLLENRAQVVEWLKGTLLTDYQKRLPSGLFRKFLEAYQKSLYGAFPNDRPFFYPYNRILMWAEKPRSDEVTED